MPYSQSLADRVRLALQNYRGISEKKMFGSLVFMFNGNMLVGVWKSSLIVRLGPDQAATALKESHVREFDLTGRPMKGWVMVEPDGLESDRQLAGWIERAMEFVGRMRVK
jgi:TfoX/Sxy family transcriptional regulator of competence genes